MDDEAWMEESSLCKPKSQKHKRYAKEQSTKIKLINGGCISNSYSQILKKGHRKEKKKKRKI